MRIWKILVGVILLNASLLWAKQLELFVETASFRADDTTAYWELMFAIPDTCFVYQRVRGGYEGEIALRIVVEQDGKEVINDVSRVVAFSALPVRTFRRTVVGWKHYRLRVGEARVKISAYSLPDRRDSLQISFGTMVRRYSAEKLELSDLILAKELRAAKPGDAERFVLNGLYVLPNPSKLIVSETPHLRLYCEVYNAKRVAPEGYEVVYRIYDVVGRSQGEVRRSYRAVADAQVAYIDLPIDVVPSGVYTVEVTARAKGQADSVMRRKKFFVYNPNQPPVSLDVLAELADFQQSPFATMTEEQVDREVEQLKPLLPERVLALYKALDSLDAKRKFLFRFWLLQDPDPTTKINEAREDFLKRIEYANQYFSSPQFREGWQSDRGRVLRQYGFPDEVDRYPMKGFAPPYEIWKYYNLEEGVIFVFVDFQGVNTYRLVHSTKDGELFDPYWEDKYIRRSGSDVLDRENVFNKPDWLPGMPR